MCFDRGIIQELGIRPLKIYRYFCLFPQSIADELGEDMSAEEIKEMINVADYDRNGVVGLDEFKQILRNKDFE